MSMRMYQRYMDDSNQIADIAPANVVYNAHTGKLVRDDSLEIVETEEERTV